MPNDGVLVVGSRAAWLPTGPERNATLYGADGTVVRSACFGDGIEHVVTTASGSIWVGYFDEGVIGNNGWFGPGPAPIGASGLNRFDERLERVWSNDAVGITDCYAMAGLGEDCVICPYTSFSVSRFSREGHVTTIQNDVRGATAIALKGGLIALAGGYTNERTRVVLCRVDVKTQQLISVRSGHLSLPDDALSTTALVGRDGLLHACVGTSWHAISVRQLSSELGVDPD